MPRLGLMDPAKAVKSGLGFKEGNVRIDKACFAVFQSEPFEQKDGTMSEQRPAIIELRWDVTRLDEELADMLNDDGEAVKESLHFSLGGKTLAQVHPGTADSPDASDDEVDDSGSEPGSEGQTVFLVNKNFTGFHEMSGIMHLSASLRTAGMKPAIIDRMWAPDYEGMVCHVGTEVSKETMKGSDGKDRPINYKVVTKIHNHGGKAKKTAGKTTGKPAAAAAGAAPSKADAITAKVESLLGSVFVKIAAEGGKFTKKALAGRVANKMQKEQGYDPKCAVPALNLIKDDNWLFANAEQYGFEFDGDNIDFGDTE